MELIDCQCSWAPDLLPGVGAQALRCTEKATAEDFLCDACRPDEEGYCCGLIQVGDKVDHVKVGYVEWVPVAGGQDRSFARLRTSVTVTFPMRDLLRGLPPEAYQ